MIRTELDYPFVTYKIHSRCIIIRELSRTASGKNIQRVFRIIMNEIIIPVMNRFNIEMLSYAIEGNNFYFIITTFKEGERISKIIQHIKSQFAERYNNMMNRTGPFWIKGSAYEIVD
jgi:hypothetical protein